MTHPEPDIDKINGQIVELVKLATKLEAEAKKGWLRRADFDRGQAAGIRTALKAICGALPPLPEGVVGWQSPRSALLAD